MKLYHYTSVFHLIKIMEDGYINTTESNANYLKSNAANDVVWFTSNKNPRVERILTSVVDKRQVRIVVDIKATQYLHWAKKNEIDKLELKILNEKGGYQSNKWFVVEHPVPKSEWLQIELFDYTSNRWLDYSLELHRNLIGKIRAIKHEDGTMEVADESSALIVQMMEAINKKSDFEIEMEVIVK